MTNQECERHRRPPMNVQGELSEIKRQGKVLRGMSEVSGGHGSASMIGYSE